MNRSMNEYEYSQVNMVDWLPVDTSSFNSDRLKKYKQRKRALDLYLSSEYTLSQVATMTKLSTSEIKRIRRRALTVAENGSHSGYLACIPNFNIKGYKRTKTSPKAGGGQFSFFLLNHPKIKEKLDSWALGHSSPTHVAVRGRFYKRIYQAFRHLCEEEGMDINTEYPFTNRDIGMGAIRTYCVKLKEKHFAQAAKVDFGDFAGRLCINSNQEPPQSEPIRPYDIVELDGHKVDSEISIKLLDEFGNIQYVPLSRIWLLTLIDCASRAVLGYSLSLSQNYGLEDVLTCIASALDCSSDILPGLPTAEVDLCKGRLFNCIKFDNAYSHTSAWLQEKLIEVGVQEVITNRPARPRSNAIIERFFETLEEQSIHQFPTTTGSKPGDPRRRNPLKAAKNLAIHLEDIENALQDTIDDYNHCPHSSLNGRSPIEFLQYSIDNQLDLIRFSSETEQTTSVLYRRQYPVTIRGNKALGHPPCIQFTNARYTSKRLKFSPALIGEKAIFEIDIRDIRSGRLYLRDGKFIDEVTVGQQWTEHKHSLRDRRVICKLAREKKINFERSSPVKKYTDYLAERSLTRRKERNEYIKVTRMLDRPHPKASKQEDRLPLDPGRAVSLTNISNTR